MRNNEWIKIISLFQLECYGDYNIFPIYILHFMFLKICEPYKTLIPYSKTKMLFKHKYIPPVEIY